IAPPPRYKAWKPAAAASRAEIGLMTSGATTGVLPAISLRNAFIVPPCSIASGGSRDLQTCAILLPGRALTSADQRCAGTQAHPRCAGFSRWTSEPAPVLIDGGDDADMATNDT